MNWFKIEMNDVFFNGLTTAQIGCVVKYKCLLQHFNLKRLDERRMKTNFSSRERAFIKEYFGLDKAEIQDLFRYDNEGVRHDDVADVNQKFVQNESEVNQKSIKSQSKVNQKFVQSKLKVCSENDNKNNDLIKNSSRADILNIKNNTNIREEKNIIPPLYSPPYEKIDEGRQQNEAEGQDKKRKRFKPPTIDEVKAYVAEKNLSVNPDKFYTYFAEGNWHDGEGKPVKNWKQKLLTWDAHASRTDKTVTASTAGSGYVSHSDRERAANDEMYRRCEITKKLEHERMLAKWGAIGQQGSV